MNTQSSVEETPWGVMSKPIRYLPMMSSFGSAVVSQTLRHSREMTLLCSPKVTQHNLGLVRSCAKKEPLCAGGNNHRELRPRSVAFTIRCCWLPINVRYKPLASPPCPRIINASRTPSAWMILPVCKLLFKSCSQSGSL